ncbi:phospholipase [Dyella sp.]|uniref:esterase/lipase family protein n=1 Tax=Dyella sp. TaxID=1869338 RepID=UPI002ED588BA
MTTLVFVHGWSVTDTSTYGTLPAQLQQQSAHQGLNLRLVDICLSQYVSFDDAVTMADLVRAFDHALADLQLGDEGFACITHSTGGPLVRQWLRARRGQPTTYRALRLTHLVMLAPANFGSALAQLGKGALGKLKAWWNGIEPGQRILDWLELGSAESLALNLDHIHGDDPAEQDHYQFVLTGDRPDRTFYDHINSYTGETGSDGVVRMASANLNARHAVLTHAGTVAGIDTLQMNVTRAPRTAFRLISGASHSGAAHGIMAHGATETIDCILRCLAVRDTAGYRLLCQAFDRDNALRDRDRVELETVGPFEPRVHIHDPRSQLIMRLTDETGEVLADSRVLLRAGLPPNPDWMPQGFMLDRQANRRAKHVISLFLNHSLLAGSERIADPRQGRRTLRAAMASHSPYSLCVQPAILNGLVHHTIASSHQDDDLLDVLGPHETTVLDIVMPRKVREGVFRLTRDLSPQDFSHPEPGKDIV